MNLLAHALLSGFGTEIRLGNLLADFVKGRERKAMPPEFLAGVRQHQAVDAFTDLHPIVSRSKARINGFPYVTGILVDVFYDHFLALHWDKLSPRPLSEFTREWYEDLRSHQVPLPDHTQALLRRLINDDWLSSYGRMDFIHGTLVRLDQRLEGRVGRTFGLNRATAALLANFDELQEDFLVFFPQLQTHVASSLAVEAATHAGQSRLP